MSTASWSRNPFAQQQKRLNEGRKETSLDTKGGEEQEATRFSHQEEAPLEAEREKRNAEEPR